MSVAVLFAADTLVRFKNGRILIHTTSSSVPAYETDNPSLIGWLCQFARPTDAAAALAALAPADRAAITPIVDYLRNSGALVAAQSPQAKPPSAEDAAQMSRNHVKVLARSIYDLACDLLGLGPFAEQELAKRSGVGVERRLMALLAASDGLRHEFAAIRVAHLTEQLQHLGLTPASRDLKLHIGCGKSALPGWVNIDVHPAPLAMNILRGLPFAAQSVRSVFVAHLLEHLYFPRDVNVFLTELRRVMTPGGIVRIVVPDIEACLEAYRDHDRTFFASRRETWSWWPENPTRLEDFLAYAGAGAEPAYLFESHKYGYDLETLERTLQKHGFGNIVRSRFMQSAHADLRVDDVSAVAKARYGDRYYSLFVEASAP